MRFSFQTTDTLVGFSASSARGGGSVEIDAQNFLSSDDGAVLVSRLEQISAVFLRSHKVPLRESQIETLLVVMHRDKRVDVVLNELKLVAKVRPKRDVTAGEAATLDDFVDIDEVRVPHPIPDDCGFVLLMSLGWQRGLLYDFLPLHDGLQPPPRELPKLLAAAFSYLMFRDRFALSDVAWSSLIAQRWFPFASLPHTLLGEMINHAHAGWSVDDLLPRITDHVRTTLRALRDFVTSNDVFERHRAIFHQAIDAYERGDYAIVVQAVFPRLEGVFRDQISGSPKNSKALADTLTSTNRHWSSLLLPGRFRDYINEVLFASESFAVPKSVTKVTRHSVAHGVASEALFDEKNATLALLILQHLGHIFRRPVS